jgi:WD40 repeat protein
MMVYMAGSSLVMWNFLTGKKDFIWNEGVGVTALAANPQRGLIAVGEEGKKPAVHVYHYPQKSLLFTLRGGAVLMYTLVEFSRSGEYIVTVGDFPNYDLQIWHGKECLAKVALEMEPFKAVFHDKVLLLFKKELRVLILHNAYTMPTNNEAPLTLKHRTELLSFNFAEASPLDAVWDKYGQIYVSTDANELLVLDSVLQARVRMPLAQRLLSLELTHRYLLAATDTNRVLWYNIYIPPEVSDPRLGSNLNLRVAKELILEEACDIPQLTYTPDFSKLILVSSTGKIQVVSIPADPDFSKEDEESEHDEAEDEGEFDEEGSPRKPKSISAMPQILGNFQVGCIRKVVGLGDSSQVVTVAEDLRIWEVVTNEVLAQIQSEFPLHTVEANERGTLVVVGSENGRVLFYDVSNRILPRLIHLTRVYKKCPVTHMKASPDQSLLAIGSMSSPKVIFLVFNPVTGFRVIGFWKAPGKVVALAWFKHKVLLLLKEGIIVQLEAPRTDTESRLEPLQLTAEYRHVEVGHSIAVTDHGVIEVGFSRQIYYYELPSQSYEELDLRKNPPEPSDIIADHPVFCNLVTTSNDLIASGSIDGTIRISRLGGRGSETKIVHSGTGVQHLSFSLDGSLLFSTGQDGDFFVWNTTGRVFERPALASVTEDPSLEALETIEEAETACYTEFLAEKIAAEEAPEIMKAKEQAKQKVEASQKRLQEMLKFNETVPELERLERDEFVIDIEERKRIERLGQKLAIEVQQEAAAKNSKNDKLLERIKDKTWRKMEEQSVTIGALRSGKQINNYTIRKLEADEERRFSRAMVFRAMELREQAIRKEQRIPEVFASSQLTAEYIVNRSPESWKEHPLLKALLAKRQTELKEGERLGFSEWELVYPASQITSSFRQLMQVSLLQMLVRAIKMGFNVEFEKLKKQKEKVLDSIFERNQQIVEKQKELEFPTKVYEAPHYPLENPDKMLKVLESEVPVEKYLTRAQREAIEEERKKEEERQRLLNADDSMRRALQQMMGGAPGAKKDTYSALQENLVREDWMDLPAEDLNDEQRNALKEFEEKDKKLNEEKKRIRKILEGELRKLESDVVESCEKFDQKLEEVFQMRLRTEYDISQLEQMAVRLVISYEAAQKREEEMKELDVKKGKLQGEITSLSTELEGFGSYRMYQTSQRDILKNEAKSKLTYFKAELGENEVKNKAECIRLVEPKSKSNRKHHRPKEQLVVNSLDPYKGSDKTEVKQTEFDELDISADCPAGLERVMFEKLVTVRNKLIDLKLSRREMKHKIREIDRHTAYLEELRQRHVSEREIAVQEFKRLHELHEKEKYNLELMLRMKQAIVEVPQLPVATDYSTAILVPIDSIESLNKQILKRGSKKIEKLEEIKVSRIQLAKEKWEKRKFELETKDLEERHLEVKLLKSDKRTQNILSGIGLDENKKRAEQLEKQLGVLASNTAKRVEMLHKKEQILSKKITEFAEENERLEDEVRDMQEQKNQRSELITLKASVSDKTKHDPARKFKQISTRRHLFDLAKQQAEEIEILRDELERLRARTFPSFAHLQAQQDLPDEI